MGEETDSTTSFRVVVSTSCYTAVRTVLSTTLVQQLTQPMVMSWAWHTSKGYGRGMMKDLKLLILLLEERTSSSLFLPDTLLCGSWYCMIICRMKPLTAKKNPRVFKLFVKTSFPFLVTLLLAPYLRLTRCHGKTFVMVSISETELSLLMFPQASPFFRLDEAWISIKLNSKKSCRK